MSKYIWFNQENLKDESLAVSFGISTLSIGFIIIFAEIIKQTWNGIGGILLMVMGLIMLIYSRYFENLDKIERLESKMKK